MVRSLVFAAGAAGLLLAGSASAAGKPLFVSANGKADARNDRVLERLLNNPSTRDVKIVNVDASASDGAQIELSVGGRQLTVNRSRAERTATGSDVWYGHVQHAPRTGYAPRETSADPLNDVVLVRHGNQITGSVRVDGQLYRIRPLPSGATAVVQVDENGMPATIRKTRIARSSKPRCATGKSPPRASPAAPTALRRAAHLSIRARPRPSA